MIDKILLQCSTINQPRTLASVALKVAEESGELAQAVNKSGNVVEEAADTIIAAVDTAYLHLKEKYGAETLIAASALLETTIESKLQKWNNLYSLEGKR